MVYENSCLAFSRPFIFSVPQTVNKLTDVNAGAGNHTQGNH